MLMGMTISIDISTSQRITKVSKLRGYKMNDQPLSVYSCEIQVFPNEIIFVEEKADYPWTQMLR